MFMPAQVGSVNAVWCHLFAGPFDPVEELHDFARSIGLRTAWFQGPPKHLWPMWHYDVTKTIRAKAVKAGAIQVEYLGGTGEIMVAAVDAMRAAEAQSGLTYDRQSLTMPPQLRELAESLYSQAAAILRLTMPTDGRNVGTSVDGKAQMFDKHGQPAAGEEGMLF
jgi:hypothetical protein